MAAHSWEVWARVLSLSLQCLPAAFTSSKWQRLSNKGRNERIKGALGGFFSVRRCPLISTSYNQRQAIFTENKGPFVAAIWFWDTVGDAPKACLKRNPNWGGVKTGRSGRLKGWEHRGGKETESQDGRQRQTRNNNSTRVQVLLFVPKHTHKNGTSVKTQLLIYLSRAALIY